MNIRTEEFLEYFKEYEENDIRVAFGDDFSEFVDCLNEVDLSDKKLDYLNDIFEKDMKIFFEHLGGKQ